MMKKIGKIKKKFGKILVCLGIGISMTMIGSIGILEEKTVQAKYIESNVDNDVVEDNTGEYVLEGIALALGISVITLASITSVLIYKKKKMI